MQHQQEMSLTLLSNGCTEDFPDNSISNFSNKIPKYQIFGSQQNPKNLQIALSECYIPTKFTNIVATKCTLWDTYKTEPRRRSHYDANFVDYEFQVPSGHYNDPRDLVNALNKSVSEKFLALNIAADEKYGEKIVPIAFSLAARTGSKTKVYFKNYFYDLELSDDIARVLGFEPGVRIIHPTKPGGVFGEYSPNTNGGKTQLYAYCSVVQPSALANQMVDLLAILPWRPNNSGTDPSQHIVVQNVQWLDMVRWNFDAIAVSLRDGSGAEVGLYGSNSVFVCKIRRKPDQSNPCRVCGH